MLASGRPHGTSPDLSLLAHRLSERQTPTLYRPADTLPLVVPGSLFQGQWFLQLHGENPRRGILQRLTVLGASPPLSFLSSSSLKRKNLFSLLWFGSPVAKYILEDIVYSEPQFLEHQKAFRIFHHYLAHFLASLVNRFK